MIIGGFYPMNQPGMSDAEIQRTERRLRRADNFLHPTSMTTSADRILGEVALKFQLPQDVRNLLSEREMLIRQVQRHEAAEDPVPAPQSKPPTRQRRRG